MEFTNINSNTTWGDASASVNENFTKAGIAIEKLNVTTITTKPGKGYFSTEEKLLETHPNPIVGDTAWVGEPYPGTVYKCESDGQWTDTGVAPDIGGVNPDDLADKESVENIKNVIFKSYGQVFDYLNLHESSYLGSDGSIIDAGNGSASYVKTYMNGADKGPFYASGRTTARSGIVFAAYYNYNFVFLGTEFPSSSSSVKNYDKQLLSPPADTFFIRISGHSANPAVLETKTELNVVVKDELGEDLTEALEEINQDIESVKGIIYKSFGKNFTPVSSDNGYINSDGSIDTSSSSSTVHTYEITDATQKYYASGRTPAKSGCVLVACYDSGGRLLGTQFPSSSTAAKNYDKELLAIPAGTRIIKVNGNSSNPPALITNTELNVITKDELGEDLAEALEEMNNDIESVKEIIYKSEGSVFEVENMATGYIKNDGSVDTSSTSSVIHEYMIDNEYLNYYASGRTPAGSGYVFVAYYDNAGSFIGSQYPSSSTAERKYSKQLLSIPKGAKRIKVNGNASNMPVLETATVLAVVTMDYLNSVLKPIQDILYQQLGGIREPDSYANGYINNDGSINTSSSSSTVNDYMISDDTLDYYASGRTPVGNTYVFAAYFDMNGNFISYQFIGSSTATRTYTQQLLTIPKGTRKIRLNGNASNPPVLETFKIMNVMTKEEGDERYAFKEVEDTVGKIKDVVFVAPSQEYTAVEKSQGYLLTDGSIDPNSSNTYVNKYVIKADSMIFYASGRTAVGNTRAFVCYYSENDVFISFQFVGSSTAVRTYDNQELVIPAGTRIIRVSGHDANPPMLRSDEELNVYTKPQVNELLDNSGGNAVNPVEVYISGWIHKVYNPYLQKGKQLLKGQLHCHTNNSDGNYTPDDVANRYANVGLDFWTITDHNVITPEPAGNKMIWLCDSYEDSRSSQHIVVLNATSVAPGGDIQDVIEQLYNNDNCILDLAHPDKNNPVTISDERINTINGGISFVEVFNAQAGSSYSDRALDILLTNNNQTWGIAVDDMHISAQLMKGWVEVYTNTRNPNDIMKSLLSGNFYATNGFMVKNVFLEGNAIRVITGEDAAITTFYKENGEMLARITGKEAVYKINGTEKYVRAVSEFSDKKCWIQPFILISKQRPSASV